jgi:hypothetical protein
LTRASALTRSDPRPLFLRLQRWAIVDDAARRATERWFIHRGLPHFIHPYRATDDVFTRLLPVLATLAFLQVLSDAGDEGWSVWINMLAIIGAVAFLGGVIVAANLARKRPAFSRPRRVGVVELSIFVGVPSLVPLTRVDVVGALGILVLNLALLGVIDVGTSFGLVPMARWTLGHALHRLASAASVLLRALPLLLLIVIVVFVNMEAWQVADGLRWGAVVAVIALFFALGGAFAVLRVPRQIGEGIVPVTTLPDALPDGLEVDVPEDPRPVPPLSRRERANIALVVLVSEGILIALVVLMMFGFLVAFGMLAVSEPVVERWLDAEPEVLASLHFLGQDMVLTPVLVKVSAFLAALSGLSFTVSLLSDATYQDEFLSDLDDDLGEAFAVRAAYRASEPSPSPSIISST